MEKILKSRVVIFIILLGILFLGYILGVLIYPYKLNITAKIFIGVFIISAAAYLYRYSFKTFVPVLFLGINYFAHIPVMFLLNSFNIKYLNFPGFTFSFAVIIYIIIILNNDKYLQGLFYGMPWEAYFIKSLM
jgi:hypothetical protein